MLCCIKLYGHPAHESTYVAETVALALYFLLVVFRHSWFIRCWQWEASWLKVMMVYKCNSCAEEIVSAGGYARRTPAGNWWSWCSTCHGVWQVWGHRLGMNFRVELRAMLLRSIELGVARGVIKSRSQSLKLNTLKLSLHVMWLGGLAPECVDSSFWRRHGIRSVSNGDVVLRTFNFACLRTKYVSPWHVWFGLTLNMDMTWHDLKDKTMDVWPWL